MKSLINSNIQAMKAYTPPIDGRRSFNGLLLDFNEATQPISKNVQKKLRQVITENRLQIYPEYGGLEKKLAKYVGCQENQIILTNGSGQAIDLVFRSTSRPGDEVIIPSPSFALFYQYAELSDSKVIKPYYKEDGRFPMKEVLNSISKKTKLIVICNPNNPTGTILSVQEMEKIIKRANQNKASVMVDEAYFEFSGITAVPLLKKYKNIIVTRTFSKAFGLPALRIGYIVASKGIINEMKKVRGPYDVNMLGAVAAEATLDDENSVKKYVKEVMNKSKPMLENYFQNNGIKYYSSGANFLTFEVESADVLYEKLKKLGILIRPRKDDQGRVFIRVTIGTVKEMKKFIQIYSQLTKTI